jgi:hypothetical protein
VTAAFGAVDATAADLLECPDGPVRDQDDVSSVATITTIRSTPRDELLAAEANDAVPPISGADNYFYAVYHVVIICTGNKK